MFGLETKKKKALAYYRHSAEDKQENSVPLQRDQAQIFAKNHDIEIIHEEADEGKSGLSAKRPGFEKLFDDWVLNEDAPKFDYVLVLDVSRWGRFQDPDEAAYWEMQCKKRDIRVIYFSKGFPKEGEQLLTSLETSINRYMAAEYLRKLSDNVWRGSVKVSEQGYSAGGSAPYGYTRVLYDQQKNRLYPLKRGDPKAISNQRVGFEPETDGTQDVVKRIFDLFINKWLEPSEIATELNDDGILSATGKAWDTSKVVRVLSSETYTGMRIYNKTFSRLNSKLRKNPVEDWVRTDNAHEAIVSREIFDTAQERLYWTSPYRWRYGVHRIRKTKRDLMNYIATEIATDYDEDRRYWLLRKLPITFGLTYYQNGESKRCFRITDDMQQYEEIIGFSVNMFVKDKIDAIFIIPTSMFGIGKFTVLSDNDKRTIDFKVDDAIARQKLEAICNTIQ